MQTFDEKELFEGSDPEDHPHPFQEGTVGWSGSPEIAELGTESGDGMTLVRVTLFLGSPMGAPQSDDGCANGREVQARLLGPPWRVPKRGARVLLVFPGGDWRSPGNAVVLGEVGGTPSTRFGRTKTVLDYGADDVVITGASVSLVCEANNGDGTTSRHVVSVSGDGGAQVVSDGSGLFAKTGEVDLKVLDDGGNLQSAVVMTQSEVSLFENAGSSPSTLTLTGGNVTMVGQFISLGAFTGVKLGAVAALPVLIGAAPPGAPSTFILGQ
jgi:hypothetical protein